MEPAFGRSSDLRRVRLLGRGGMGEVWLCRDEALGVDRAVKFLLPERADTPALRVRFTAEARMLASLGDAPGVVRVHFAGDDPSTGRPFFVMDAHLLAPERIREICTRRLGLPPAAAEAVVRHLSGSRGEGTAVRPADGGNPAPCAPHCPFTLQDALGSEFFGTARQLPERAVLDIAREIAAALSFLHGRTPAIVHRDVKPSNMLFSADGRLLLADFGVAKTLDPALSGLTFTGGQPGTQRYAAPETLRGEPAAPAADWYALGVVLFRALTSSFPQWGESFPTRSGLRPFSPLWEPLLRDLLAPDPSLRLADVGKLARRLDRIEASIDRPNGARCRKAAKFAAVFAAAAVAVGSAALLVRRAEPDSSAAPDRPDAPAPSIAETAENAETGEPAKSSESTEVAETAKDAENEAPAGIPVPDAAAIGAKAAAGGGTGSDRPTEAETPSERRENPEKDVKADAKPRTTGRTYYYRGEDSRIPLDTLIANALKSEDLLEFRPSMRRKLVAVIPMETSWDDVGIPPDYNYNRLRQAISLGEQIEESVRKAAESLYGRRLAGETIDKNDVLEAGLDFHAWSAWAERQDRERAAPAP